MKYINRVKIEFRKDPLAHKDTVYQFPQPVEWVKTDALKQNSIDAIQISRDYPIVKARAEDGGSTDFEVVVSVWLSYNPKKFKLSPELSKLLDMKEETRANVIAALW